MNQYLVQVYARLWEEIGEFHNYEVTVRAETDHDARRAACQHMVGRGYETKSTSVLKELG